MEVKRNSAEIIRPVAPKSAGNSAVDTAAKTDMAVKSVAEPAAKNKDQEQQNSQRSRDDVKNITQELNKFFQYINADLQFAMHEKTQQLMVQVVDTKENKVLREFPSHELLDTIANIREYVGILLDKKA